MAVTDDRIVGVRGRAGDRINHGRLGPKGLYGWQANHARDRLIDPLVRGGDGAVEQLLHRTHAAHGHVGGVSVIVRGRGGARPYTAMKYP
ncbi:hypothetical protein DMB38_34490 [Streptomyces sp. WAC 06738]|uniref:hypothetical protein n=1 Tax=Streptomyces sp. WAC 06738 TaxID=2203210 RepID=UPI000F6D6BF4|nr:hypothetical protein [Streptomyces sp. WAC 06738]AZM50214.1 hypothetical protein DMB38_34490 [Streptomyces sp. WAC 06738]